jgi:hypothetical protein
VRLDIVIKDGKHCPAIFCDVCRKQITGESAGIVAYGERDKESPLYAQSKYEILFAHKGTCAETPRLRALLFWQDLDVFLVYLLDNADVDYKDARTRAEFLASIF